MGNKVAIISPEKSPYSATFIKAHIDLLDADVRHLYGVFFPKKADDGQYNLREFSLLKKAFSKLGMPGVYNKYLRNPQLIRYFKKQNIQLVLAEFGPVGAEVLECCQALHIPLIVHFHGYDAYVHGIFKKYGEKYKAMFAYASYLVAVSSDMKKKLIEVGAPEHKIVLNPYGPNHAFFRVKPSFQTCTFIAVGRFVEKKAPHLTLEAFRQVKAAVPEVRLLMVGEGKLLEKCQHLVKDWNLETSVTFYGAATPGELISLFENAYCFVQHSIVATNGDSEGTPVAVLEACAAGLPVIATRHAGIQDVIIHGETGFLVEEHDVESMADCMVQLAKNKSLTQQFGHKGRQVIKESYMMDKHISTLDTLIESLLKN